MHRLKIPLVYLVVIILLNACGGKSTLINFVVRDNQNRALPQSRITVKLKDSQKDLITNSQGLATLKFTDRDIPSGSILYYEVTREGYHNYQRNLDLLPVRDAYNIQATLAPGMPAPTPSGASPSLPVKMGEDGDKTKELLPQIDFVLRQKDRYTLADIQNTGEVTITGAKIKVTARFGENAEEIVKEDAIGNIDLKGVERREFDLAKLLEGKDLRGAITVAGSVSCNECGQIAPDRLTKALSLKFIPKPIAQKEPEKKEEQKVLPSLSAGVDKEGYTKKVEQVRLPNLLIEIEVQEYGQIALRLSNTGGVRVTGARVRVTADFGDNEEELIEGDMIGDLELKESKIKQYDLPALIKGKQSPETFILTGAVSCNECANIDKAVLAKQIGVTLSQGASPGPENLPFSHDKGGDVARPKDILPPSP